MFEIRTVSVPWKKNKVLRKFGERGGRWRYVSGRCGRKQQVHNSKPWLFSGANYLLQFSSVQSLGHVRLFATPWIAARQASLSITSSRNLLKLMPIELVTSSSHLILCHPLRFLPSESFPMSQLFAWGGHYLLNCTFFSSYSDLGTTIS